MTVPILLISADVPFLVHRHRTTAAELINRFLLLVVVHLLFALNAKTIRQCTSINSISHHINTTVYLLFMLIVANHCQLFVEMNLLLAHLFRIPIVKVYLMAIQDVYHNNDNNNLSSIDVPHCLLHVN